MKTTKFLSIFLAVLYFAFVVSLSSCKKDKGDPPTLPPSSSFVMDFSDFKTANKSALAVQDSTSNLGLAVGNVFFWNVMLTVGLAVPVAAFVESFHHQPELNNDDWWVWSYSVNSYSAELHGKVSGQQVNWEMYISGPNFQNFKWYTGTSQLNGTSGQWILYESPLVNTTLLQIDWHNNGDGTSDIRYMNIKPNGPENSGYIMYGLTNGSPYNAYYKIYNKGIENLTEIEWNRTSKEGHIKDPHFYNDTNFHGWDSTGHNTSSK